MGDDEALAAEKLREERDRAIALLEAAHQFPTEYELSVIAQSDEEVFAAVSAAVNHGLAAPLGAGAYEAVPSKGGKYTSHRFRVPCARPEDVLALYARLRAIKGVMTLL